MAAAPGAKKAADTKGKKKNTKGVRKVSTQYEISGTAIRRKNSPCPKCGPGFSMAIHKNRITCGKCMYTEFKKG